MMPTTWATIKTMMANVPVTLMLEVAAVKKAGKGTSPNKLLKSTKKKSEAMNGSHFEALSHRNATAMVSLTKSNITSTRF